MLKLVLGLVIFLGVHSIRIVAPGWRDRMIARLGIGGWKGLYSIASLAGFVLTVGATANQNGTALFEGVTVIFLAQFFGVDLSLAEQVTVMFVCILGGIGTAGVPAGSLPVVALICGMVGVPPEGIGLILGVDRFLDMCRTTLNVTGDLMLATVVSNGEGEAKAA